MNNLWSLTKNVIDRYDCTFHVQGILAGTVTELENLIKNFLNQEYRNDTLSIQTTRLTVQNICKTWSHTIFRWNNSFETFCIHVIEEQVRVEASCTWMSSGGLLLALGLGSLSAVGLVLATKTIPLQTMEKALGGCHNVAMSVPQCQRVVQKKLWQPSTGCTCGPRRVLRRSKSWNVRSLATTEPTGYGEIITTLSPSELYLSYEYECVNTVENEPFLSV